MGRRTVPVAREDPTAGKGPTRPDADVERRVRHRTWSDPIHRTFDVDSGRCGSLSPAGAVSVYSTAAAAVSKGATH
jgi:hypothetical protein